MENKLRLCVYVLGFTALFFFFFVRLSLLQEIVHLYQDDIVLLFQVRPWGGAFFFQSNPFLRCSAAGMVAAITQPRPSCPEGKAAFIPALPNSGCSGRWKRAQHLSSPDEKEPRDFHFI